MSWWGHVNTQAGGNVNIINGNVYNQTISNSFNRQYNQSFNQFGGYVPYCQPVCQPICRPVCQPMCCALPPGDETKDDMAASDKDEGDIAAVEALKTESEENQDMIFGSGRWKLIESRTKIVSCEGPDVSISITYEDKEKIIVFGAPKTASEDDQKWNFMTGRWKLIENGAMIANCENPDFCIPIAFDRDEEIVLTGEPMRPSEENQK